MTLQSSGTISINDLVGEYGSTGSHRALTHYYRGGQSGLVANHSNNANISTSGLISLSMFYGQSNTNPAPTSHSYSMTSGSNAVITNGYDTNSFGSMGSNPQSQAFASGWNPTIDYFYSTTVKTTTFLFQVNGNGGVSGNTGWTSVGIPASLISTGSGVTLTRASGSYSQSLGTHSAWSWNVGWQIVSGVTATIVVNA